MQIKLYNFSKKLNSTSVPDDSSQTLYIVTCTGSLKEPCSVLYPQVTIERVEYPLENPPTQWCPYNLNYCYIPKFNRYYFVTDWKWNDGVWVFSANVDVLATYKSSIGALNAYVERCAGNASIENPNPDWDGAIMDKMYPATTDLDIEETYISVSWNYADISDGCYVLGVFGSASSEIGTAVDYWVLTKNQMNAFMGYLLSDQFIEGYGYSSTSTPISLGVAKSLINPIQYITSCTWYPCSYTKIKTGNEVPIKIGSHDVPSSSDPLYQYYPKGYKMKASARYEEEYDVTVPIHPQASTRGKYLMYPPFSKYTLILPPFGTMPIDISYFEVGDQLNINVCVDCVTGKARLYLGVTTPGVIVLNKRRFYETSTQFGVPIEIAQIAHDTIKTATTIVSAVGENLSASWSAFTWNFGAASTQTAGWINSIMNAVQASYPQVIAEGINGSFASYTGTPALMGRFAVVIDENREELGRPLCAKRYIRELAGYVKLAEVEIDFPQTFEEEKKTITSMLLGGFFYE